MLRHRRARARLRNARVRGGGAGLRGRSKSVSDDLRPHRLRPLHLLAIVPQVALLGGIPFVNRVEPYVLGLPFLLFWIVLWVVVTSLTMGLILLFDRRS